MDFETLIGKSLAEGTDPDELAKVMSEAFNKAVKQKEAAEAKARILAAENSERNKVINAVDKTFWDHVKNQSLDIADATALTFLVIVNDTEFGKSLKTASELSSLYRHIGEMVNSVEDVYKIKKTFSGIFGEVSSELFDSDKLSNKSKDSTNGDTCGTDRKCKITISDKNKIEEFLRRL